MTGRRLNFVNSGGVFPLRMNLAPSRHGAKTWVTLKGQDMGNTFWLDLRPFRGYAVEIYLAGRSTLSLRKVALEDPSTLWATVSTLSHQPQDRIQVEGAFLGQRSSWFAQSIATAQTPTEPDSSVLDATHWADASAPSTLGSQKAVSYTHLTLPTILRV